MCWNEWTTTRAVTWIQVSCGAVCSPGVTSSGDCDLVLPPTLTAWGYHPLRAGEDKQTRTEYIREEHWRGLQFLACLPRLNITVNYHRMEFPASYRSSRSFCKQAWVTSACITAGYQIELELTAVTTLEVVAWWCSWLWVRLALRGT